MSGDSFVKGSYMADDAKKTAESESSTRLSRVKEVLGIVIQGTIALSVLTGVITFYFQYRLNQQAISLNNIEMIQNSFKILSHNREGRSNSGRSFAIVEINKHGILLNNVKAWNLYIADRNLNNVSLIRANLRGLTLNDVTMKRAKLQFSKLQENNKFSSKILHSDLSGSNFTGSNMNRLISWKNDYAEANLSKTTFTNVTDRDSSFVNANFSDANLCGSQFLGSNLSGVVFSKTQPSSKEGWKKFCDKQKLDPPCVNKKAVTTAGDMFVRCESERLYSNNLHSLQESEG